MSWIVHHGDCLDVMRTMPDCSVDCCVTSPPYWGLRDYGHAGQIGLEPTHHEYVARMVEVFREVRRVLHDDGTLWLNLGDSYNAKPNQRGIDDITGSKQATNVGSRSAPSRNVPDLKPKDLVGIPWRVAFALQSDGWYLRQDIIWSKPNPMPESVTDRCTKSHEYLFLLAKSERYHWDAAAMREPSVTSDVRRPYASEGAWSIDGRAESMRHGGEARTSSDAGVTRNRRSVWTITTKPFDGAHFATFPPELITPCVRASCPPGGIVLDPFAGAGTTGLVAAKEGANFVGIEINPKYVEIARRRIAAEAAQGKLEFI